jgi:hypothetical protein
VTEEKKMVFNPAAGITVVQVISSTIATLKNALDLAKDSKNRELKGEIGKAFDSMNDLRDRILSLDEENRNLKAKLAERDSILGPVLPFGYYYLATDTEQTSPLCPQCWQDKGQKYPLQAEPWNGGRRQRCRCGFIKQETTGPTGPASMARKPYTPPIGRLP